MDDEVNELVHNAYAKATELLKSNRDKLEKLAATLLDKESMDGRDVAELLGLPFKDEAPEEVHPATEDEKSEAEPEESEEAPVEEAKPAEEPTKEENPT